MSGRAIDLRIDELVLTGVDGDAHAVRRELERELGERLGQRSWEGLASRSLARVDGGAVRADAGGGARAIAAGVAGALERELLR